MIIKDALRSLKDDFLRSFFYFLTLLVTSMFIYLFFNIMMSDPVGVSLLEGSTDLLATAVTVAVVVICLIAILFANDFFAKRKAKELAVRLICGATAFQLASYLLIQTVLLMVVALPLGILIANLLIPVLNTVLSAYLQSEFLIGIHSYANTMSAVILGLVIFWILMLNMSFALKNGAAMMFSENIMTKAGGAPVFYFGAIPQWLKATAMTLLFLVPIACFYLNSNMIFLLTILSLVGFMSWLDDVLIPWLTKRIHSKPENHLDVVWMGFLRTDIAIMKPNISLFIVAVVLLAWAMITKHGKPVEMMLYILSYVVMGVLLSMAILFKYSTELAVRKRYFNAMFQIGYLESDLKKIMTRQILWFYGLILAVSLLYLVNIFLSQMIAGVLSVNFMLVLLAFAVVPMILVGLINLLTYRSSLELKKER